MRLSLLLLSVVLASAFYLVRLQYQSRILFTAVDREQAMARMRPALSAVVVEGIKTNVPLHQELMVDAGFAEGGTNIHYLEHWLSQRKR